MKTPVLPFLALGLMACLPVLAQTPTQAPARSAPRIMLADPLQAGAAIQAVRLLPDERIKLDGTLSHPAWLRAPEHERFVERDPISGAQPPQQTRFRVLFDERAVYVGVTALDSDPALIRDPIVRADQVNRTQDFVVVYLDAIGTQRSAQFFRVSAAGSKGDGLHTATDDTEDFSPDFDWDAAVSRQAQGWTAVFRLPFASLRYAPGTHDWRIMVGRRLPRENFHFFASVPIPRDSPSFIHHMQPLLGVSLPQESQFLTLRPSLTLRREEAPQSQSQSQGHGQSSNKLSASLDLKWRPRAEVVVDGTLNPDFSQVALDVPQLAANSRFALFFPEKRPFFFESADLLRTPTEAFYTRSFTEPLWGLRATWRSTTWAGTALVLDDRGKGLLPIPGPYGTDYAEQPASRVLAARARSDGGNLQWGGVLATRQYADQRGENSVLGPDLAWQISGALRLRAQWLHSQTTALTSASGLKKQSAVGGDRVYLRAYHQTESTEANLGVDDLGSGFRHDSGFVNQAGVRKWHAGASKGWQRVGPFNQFYINAEWERVTDRQTGQVVSEYARPGIWTTGARNFEWWAEWFDHSVLRTAVTEPLIAERFLATGMVITPARWFPLLDTKLTLGDLADTQANQARPGGTFRVMARLRPLARLEFETTASTAWLKHQGRTTYSESALQTLGVWHFNAQHNLRVIVQRRLLRRLAEADANGQPAVEAARSAGLTTSLTYTWRQSAGTLLYVGATSRESGAGSVARNSEAFVKLQVDVDEARAMLRGPR